jgi:hypothetical protein
LQNVRILRQILDSILSPQTLILLKSSPDIYHFLAEYCNLQKNIGPIEDSMSDFKSCHYERDIQILHEMRFTVRDDCELHAWDRSIHCVA